MKDVLKFLGLLLAMLSLPWLFYVADVLTRGPVECETNIDGITYCRHAP